MNLPSPVSERSPSFRKAFFRIAAPLLAGALPLCAAVDALGASPAPAIASARWDTLLLASDGSVYGCANGADYVVDPYGSGYPVLQLPKGSASWISAGRYFGFADGNLLLGFDNPPAPPSSRPVAGYSATFYIDGGGTVYSAGQNAFGYLGDPTIPLLDPTGATQDGITTTYSLVKRGNGSNLTGIVSVVSGSSFIAALDRQGSVWTWGHNGWGELGDGTLNNRAYASKVRGLEEIVAISANTGRYRDAPFVNGLGDIGSQLHDHALALTSGGKVWAWGENRDGELGNGTLGIAVTNPLVDSAPVSRPVLVLVGPGTPLTGVVAIAVGGAHSMALRRDGTVWTWGYNGSGQLGSGSAYNGVKVDNGLPVNSYAHQVPGLSQVRAIAAGPAQSFAIDAFGSVYSWGWNDHGTLCVGNTLDPQTSPVLVTNSDGSSFSLGQFPYRH
jgi:hypothetical protein